MEQWIKNNMDDAAQVPEMESLIADIKTIVESSYASDKVKVRRVIAAIQDYGY